MRKHVLRDIREHFEPYIAERVEEVTLDVEYNPKKYATHAQYDAAYRESRVAFEKEWPEARMEMDALIANVNLRCSALMREVYKQGARDCASLLHRLGVLNADMTKEEVSE